MSYHLDPLLPETKKFLDALKEMIWNFVQKLSLEQRKTFKIHLLAWIAENL